MPDPEPGPDSDSVIRFEAPFEARAELEARLARRKQAPAPDSVPDSEPVESTSETGADTPVEAPDTPDEPDAEQSAAERMPIGVRAAQVLAVGLAVIGVGCVLGAWWLFGGHAALVTAPSFVASWLLGAVALAFGAEGGGIRSTAIVLAALNVLWTIPSIVVGRPPGWLGPVLSVLIAGLLLRRSARDWFEPWP